MNHFNARDLVHYVQLLSMAFTANMRQRQAGTGGVPIDKGHMSITLRTLRELQDLCNKSGMPQSAAKIQLSLVSLEGFTDLNASYIESELRNIIECVIVEMSALRFLRVSDDRVKYLDVDTPMSEAVARAFPSAVPDLREAGNCLAAECNTAAVFHLMRAVEWGLRALCASLGIRTVKAVTKSGKRKYTPVSYAEWERILHQVQSLVDSKLMKMKRNKEKQAAQEF